MEKYARDDKGNIPKRNDHLIDCLRYFNILANYNMVEVIEAVKLRNEVQKDRYRKLHFQEDDEGKDWTSSIFKDL
jgi:hypothetical protein